MIIRCTTTFDITATGVRSNFNINRIPFTDSVGHLIDSESAWIRARNQQRNWETLNQIISLRCLPTNITHPCREVKQQSWWFEFEIDSPSALATDSDVLGELYRDCASVPMLTGLDDSSTDPWLIPKINIHFEIQNR